MTDSWEVMTSHHQTLSLRLVKTVDLDEVEILAELHDN